ncbi:unnamed protein product [Rangifer tarandus platyrhynchus]|uniref:Uncharacterized protein n=2 Tax=Rangifer tarandus platyrhynchus TaxID=3082113 RepID=A0ABN8YFS8_RANTA|nr:unnamed protein product [Rangifer tarandus platyrhynchus]
MYLEKEAGTSVGTDSVPNRPPWMKLCIISIDLCHQHYRHTPSPQLRQSRDNSHHFRVSRQGDCLYLDKTRQQKEDLIVGCPIMGTTNPPTHILKRGSHLL